MGQDETLRASVRIDHDDPYHKQDATKKVKAIILDELEKDIYISERKDYASMTTIIDAAYKRRPSEDAVMRLKDDILRLKNDKQNMQLEIDELMVNINYLDAIIAELRQKGNE